MVSNSGGTGIYVTSGTLTVGSTSSTSNTNPLITSNGGYAINGNFTMYSGRLRSNTNTNVYSGTNLYTAKSGYYWHHNSTSGNYEYYWNTDTTGPTVTFGTNGSTTWQKSHSTTVTVTDPGGSGVNSNTLKYRWTQSTTAPALEGFSSAPSFINGETITKSEDTGNNWYLWVAARDNLGNTTITRSNAFYLDNTLPINVSVTPNTTNWTNGSVTLTGKAQDVNSGIVAYAWTDSAATPASTVWKTRTSTTSIITYTTDVSTNNTTKYFHVKDIAGNTKYSSYTVSKIDKAAPTITTATGTSRVKGNTNSVSISVSGISDTGGSGLKGYHVSYNNSTAPTASSSWTNSTAASFTYTVGSVGTYYIWVIDNAGNISAAKSCTFTESTAVAERVGGTASNGTKYFATLQAAITSATSDTINLLADVSENTSIASGKTITLALATHQITGNIINSGTLTVNGTGTITCARASVCTIANYGILELNTGVTVNSTSYWCVATADNPATNVSTTIAGATLRSTGTGCFYGGATFKMSSGWIDGQGSSWCVCLLPSASATISGGTINASKFSGVLSKGTLEMTAGRIDVSGGTAVHISSGEFNISGGLVKTTKASFDAIYVETCTKITVKSRAGQSTEIEGQLHGIYGNINNHLFIGDDKSSDNTYPLITGKTGYGLNLTGTSNIFYLYSGSIRAYTPNGQDNSRVYIGGSIRSATSISGYTLKYYYNNSSGYTGLHFTK